MFVKRTSLLGLAAVAAMVITTSSGAEAFSLCQRGGYSKFTRGFSPYRSAGKVVKKPSAQARYAKAPAAPARPVRPAVAAKPTSVAKAPAPVAVASATAASTATAAAIPAKSTTGSAAAPATAATDTCLRKEYLETGAVRFRDTCNKQWAINSTKVTTKTPIVGGACLTKETNSNGVVLFRDVCTSEWAMNTEEQMALAQAQ
jgi:hypothetical protein